MSTSDGSLPAASAGPAVVASRLPPATRARPPVAPRRRNCARVVPWVCTGAPLWSAGRLGVATLDGGLLRTAGAFGSLLHAAAKPVLNRPLAGGRIRPDRDVPRGRPGPLRCGHPL